MLNPNLYLNGTQKYDVVSKTWSDTDITFRLDDYIFKNDGTVILIGRRNKVVKLERLTDMVWTFDNTIENVTLVFINGRYYYWSNDLKSEFVDLLGRHC